MSGLPQELIDHIIDLISDRNSLKACSLVCSQWSTRSRKHLFVQVHLTSTNDLGHWLTRIRPGPSGPSSLVECLSLSDYPPSSALPSASWLQPPHLHNATSHLQSFSGLRVLKIREWQMSTLRVSSALRSFGPSCGNVTRLVLYRVAVHPSDLAIFVGHFPRLNDLSIFPVSLSDDFRPGFVTIVPTHPCGEFAFGVSTLQAQKEVYKNITLLEPRFRKISIQNSGYGTWRDYWPLVEACAGSLEELSILVNATDADCGGVSLAGCPNLRAINLSLGLDQLVRPCQFIEKCLSTITSTRLSEVSLSSPRVPIGFGLPGLDLPLWERLDIILYNLAGQYQPRRGEDRMLVKLVDVNLDPSEAGTFLRRYRERGTILQTSWRTRARSSGE